MGYVYFAIDCRNACLKSTLEQISLLIKHVFIVVVAVVVCEISSREWISLLSYLNLNLGLFDAEILSSFSLWKGRLVVNPIHNNHILINVTRALITIFCSALSCKGEKLINLSSSGLSPAMPCMYIINTVKAGYIGTHQLGKQVEQRNSYPMYDFV